MSVATTLTALQALHSGITGITRAPTAMPSVLNTSDAPIVLVWPGPATWRLQALGLKRQEREYIVRVFVQPVAQGVAGPDDGYQRCVTLLELFGQAYQDNLTLSGAVDNIQAVTDSGVSGGGFELLWGQDPWWGLVYRLTIVEKTS